MQIQKIRDKANTSTSSSKNPDNSKDKKVDKAVTGKEKISKEKISKEKISKENK